MEGKTVESILHWMKILLIDSRVLYAVLELAVGIVVIRLATVGLKRALEKSRLEKAAHSLILSLVTVGMYLLLGLMIASCLGIDVTGVVAMASVLTLSVSLALQNLLTNVFGGFTVLSNHPFHSGDYVQIGDVSGTVQEISMTYTKLATPDNKIISIPNSTVSAAQIINFSSAETRRVEISVSASYGDDTQKVIDALLDAAREAEILSDPAPFAGVTAYGDSAISYVLRFWVKNADYWDVYFRVNQKISQVFRQAGITMTYPHLNVHIDSGK